MRYTINQTKDLSSIYEIFSRIKGKTIIKAVDMRIEFQLHFNDEFVLRISGTEVNLVLPQKPAKQR